ncbi:MAG: hydrogenase 4 subunit F [Methylothermaceae bacterium]|nr:hydrogenase 4 subunit F [Methylothermaceae bacterium]
MIALYGLLLIPLGGVFGLAWLGDRPMAARINNLLSTATFVVSLILAAAVLRMGTFLSTDRWWMVDSFSVYLIVLTALVGLTTGIFSAPYMEHEREIGRLTHRRLRLYYAMYQAFMLAMYLILVTNNMGILWVAMEGATLATVLLVSLYRTPESVEAAWKYFILCGVGIAQALFGTILLYFAASQVLGIGGKALTWTTLYTHATELDPTVMKIAFVFLLVGYGTKVGLVPMHSWLPDAHSEGPTPMSAILSGLLLNDALYAIVRSKMIVDQALSDNLAGYLMMGFGLISFLVAALFLHRQRDIKRLFSYSSIEHMGMMTFAFGIGTPPATFAALMHMTTHSLTKSSIFVTVGHASHIAGTQFIPKIRGLIATQPAVGWGLLIGTLAIAGFPPFGVFVSEFLVLVATMKSFPWLTLPVLAGIGIAFAGLFKHLHPMVYGARPENQQPVRANMLPVFIHLTLVLWLGLAIPDVLANWFDHAAQLISGDIPR